MLRQRNKPSSGRSTRADRALAVSPWAWTLAVLVIALAFDVPATAAVLLVLGTLVTAVGGAGSKRIQEGFERKPDLALVAVVEGEATTSVHSPIPSPWPVHDEAVLEHELEAVRETADGLDRLARKGATGLLVPQSAFAIRPSRETHDRARRAFDREIDEYAIKLAEWLAGYHACADRRSRTFELSIGVLSARRGAYAEDVTVVIELPPEIEIAELVEEVDAPPEPPTYEPPRPRDPLAFAAPSYPTIRRVPWNAMRDSLPAVDRSGWQQSEDGRLLQRRLGNLHHNATHHVDEPLVLRVRNAGSHAITWTLRTRNGRRHRSGELRLVLPEAPDRPAITRLEGIRRFPDVSLMDEDGNLVAAARTSDPPTEAPPSIGDGSVIGRLSTKVANKRWEELGIGHVGTGTEAAAD
jgi:hypothetical protein